MSQTLSLRDLHTQMTANIEVISTYLEINNREPLSFSPHGDQELPRDEQDLQNARMALLEQTKTMYNLVQGPIATVFAAGFHAQHDAGAMTAILHYEIDKVVPLDGSTTSYEQISSACGLAVDRVRSFMRQAMMNNIFAEPRPGEVCHTAASIMMAQDPEFRAWLSLNSDYILPAVGRLSEWFKKWPNTRAANQAPFNLAMGTEEPPMAYVGSRPDMAQKFLAGMAFLNRGVEYSNEGVIKGYPWERLGSTTVVDVGGGNGHFSLSLARAYPQLKCIVQDFPAAEASVIIPMELKENVRFMAHDFFKPQPVKAGAYVLRQILHDWPDAEAAEILKSLIPSLTKGARIILIETILPPSGVLPRPLERLIRSVDLQVLLAMNSRERSPEDWETLFNRADPRFSFNGIISPAGSFWSTIEAIWNA